VKLQEIRDKFISEEIDRETAYYGLFDTGMCRPCCNELLDLWRDHFEAEVVRDSVTAIKSRKGLGLASSLELIDDAFISGKYDGADAIDLLHEAGLSDDRIEEHLDIMRACRKSHELCWHSNAEAPSWVRQISALAKLYMQGEITSWAALKQLDPKDEYPHVVGAILAHLIERRYSIAELAHDARNDPSIVDEGIEYCRICGRAKAARELSNRGLCKGCRFTIQSRVVAGLMNHSGPYYRKWRDAMLKAMYRLEDELREERMTDPEEPEAPTLGEYYADEGLDPANEDKPEFPIYYDDQGREHQEF